MKIKRSFRETVEKKGLEKLIYSGIFKLQKTLHNCHEKHAASECMLNVTC